jgi:hypothetical protein
MEKSCPLVIVITCCTDPELIYGSTLFFETIRVGFPTFPVVVIDNGSHLSAQIKIKHLAESHGLKHIQIHSRLSQGDCLRQTIFQYDGPLILLEPDILFWSSCEEWSFSGLIAGRYFTRIFREDFDCWMQPRIHPSFLWIRDSSALKSVLNDVSRPYANLFTPFAFPSEEGWVFYDHFALIFQLLEQDIELFMEEKLNCYDHLYYGSKLYQLQHYFDPAYLKNIQQWHTLAQDNPTQLRGIWRVQEEYLFQHQYKLPPNNTQNLSTTMI